VPRERTSVRMPVLGSSVRRSASSPYPSRSGNALRRRILLGVLVLLALVLVTVSFRESSGGPLHRAQGAGATVLHPFQIAAERVARPFRDVYGYFAGLVHAKSENASLKEEVQQLRNRNVQAESALQDVAKLQVQLNYVEGPTFPKDYRAVNTRVIGRPPSPYYQQVDIAAGSTQGIRVHDPVVTAAGLVGEVTAVFSRESLVTLLTDSTSFVSAVDLNSQDAFGIVSTGEGRGSLVFDRVPKAKTVSVGDKIITAGSRTGRFGSIYPRNLLIGTVTSVGNAETEIFKQIQVEPAVDFGSLDSLVVLVSTRPRPELP
jgi:rod shape-determining protein MreC